MTLNKSILIGRLVRDPELTVTLSGVSICKFTLACDRPFKNKQGEKEADFLLCKAFNKTAEVIANHMKKGSFIYAEGRQHTGSYEKDDGTKVYTHDNIIDTVKFLEYRQKNEQQQGQPQQNEMPKFEVDESNLPF